MLIKPSSGNCNMRCKYCFYDDISQYRNCENGFMSSETAKALIKKALNSVTKQITFVFQGGEPTLVGLDFYREIISLQQEYNINHVKIHNSIQTNGYIIDDEWAHFLGENHFLVGLSVDGTKDLHDLYRVDASGKGTFNRTMRAVELFRKNGVEFNILTVVTNPLARKAEAVYNFYKKQGFKYLQFIPCLNPIDSMAESYDFTLTPQRYGAFLVRIFELWCRDLQTGNAPSIRQFDNYVLMLKGIQPESCGFSGVCSMQYAVEADGGVYPCDFYVLDELKLGNINEISIEEIDRNREKLGFVEMSRNINDECKDCGYFGICRGGCRRYREPFSQGNYSKNIFCEGYKEFFRHSLNTLVYLARL